MPTTLVLFDIDGTLLLTSGAGRRAITEALAATVPESAELQHIRFDGKTDLQIVRELLQGCGHPGAENAEVVQDICQRYVTLLEAELRHPRSRATLMPGVTPLLDVLHRNPAVVLGLLTGNVREGATLKLRAAGLDPERFRVGAFGSDSAHRPDLPAIATERASSLFGRIPSGSEVVIIGDTPADVTCGRGVSARAIGVATGSYPVAELRAAGAYAAFTDLSDTARVLEAILG